MPDTPSPDPDSGGLDSELAELLNNPSGTPVSWQEEAIFRVLGAAFSAYWDDDGKAAARLVADGWQEFADTVQQHVPVDGDHELARVYGTAVLTLANFATRYGPEEWRGTTDDPVTLVAEDIRTGEVIDDPDAEVPGDPHSVGALAAARIMVAAGNGDGDAALDVFYAVDDDTAVLVMLMHIAEFAAAAVVSWLERDGKLRPEHQAILDQRRAADVVEEAAAELEPEIVERDGIAFMPLPSVPSSDMGHAHVAPEGGVSVATIHLPGGQEQAVAGAHRVIDAFAADKGEQLCGVHHFEAFEAWRLPAEARTRMNRQIRKVKRGTGREPLLVRAWQHRTPCPESMSPEDQARIPGDDDVPLFEDPAMEAAVAALTEETPR